MTTMKGAVFYDIRDVKVVEVPKPEVGDKGVMINVKAVGVCGTDVHTYKTGVSFSPPALCNLPIDTTVTIEARFVPCDINQKLTEALILSRTSLCKGS